MNPILSLVAQVAHTLQQICTSKEGAYDEAWWLLEHVTKKSRCMLLVENAPLSQAESTALETCLHERAVNRKPLQYIIGNVPFCELELVVRPPTLIPRPETEEWTQWLIEVIKKNNSLSSKLRILDVCTGSGCIALALAAALPNAEVVGIDIATHALDLARENSTLNAIKNVTFISGDIFDIADKQHTLPGFPAHYFDIIVSNPPYISLDAWQNLDQSVKGWEDPAALISAHNGLAHYHALLRAAHCLLKSPKIAPEKIPSIVIEIGYDQAQSLTTISAHQEYKNIRVHTDSSGKDRWISMLQKSNE